MVFPDHTYLHMLSVIAVLWVVQQCVTVLFSVYTQSLTCLCDLMYNAFNVYCRELAPGTVSLTGDRAQGDDSKH